MPVEQETSPHPEEQPRDTLELLKTSGFWKDLPNLGAVRALSGFKIFSLERIKEEVELNNHHQSEALNLYSAIKLKLKILETIHKFWEVEESKDGEEDGDFEILQDEIVDFHLKTNQSSSTDESEEDWQEKLTTRMSSLLNTDQQNIIQYISESKYPLYLLNIVNELIRFNPDLASDPTEFGYRLEKFRSKIVDSNHTGSFVSFSAFFHATENILPAVKYELVENQDEYGVVEDAVVKTGFEILLKDESNVPITTIFIVKDPDKSDDLDFEDLDSSENHYFEQEVSRDITYILIGESENDYLLMGITNRVLETNTLYELFRVSKDSNNFPQINKVATKTRVQDRKDSTFYHILTCESENQARPVFSTYLMDDGIENLEIRLRMPNLEFSIDVRDKLSRAQVMKGIDKKIIYQFNTNEFLSLTPENQFDVMTQVLKGRTPELNDLIVLYCSFMVVRPDYIVADINGKKVNLKSRKNKPEKTDSIEDLNLGDVVSRRINKVELINNRLYVLESTNESDAELLEFKIVRDENGFIRTKGIGSRIAKKTYQSISESFEENCVEIEDPWILTNESFEENGNYVLFLDKRSQKFIIIEF